MSKRNTPAKSAASKRAAFAGQRRQFASKGRIKSFGATAHERQWRDDVNRAWGSTYSVGAPPVASWIAI